MALTQVFLQFSFPLFLLSSFLFCVSVSAPHSPLPGDHPCSPWVPSIPPGSTGLSSHRAGGPQPEHSAAAAAGEGKHHRTECLSPSSQGRAHLGERGEVRTGLLDTSSSCLPFPLWSVRASPESILFRIVRAHFRKASSTFSPVRALVSRNISSGGRYSEGQGLRMSPFSSPTITCCLSLCSSNVPLLPSFPAFVRTIPLP